ncbi:FxsA family protein [Vogesella sp. LIG4]|uniref:FxsA family protein n=1 Tax=Vogesella sp. LIG4 TaxID=1192162 RepID=UPI00081FC396|nr:FxsA family protein [Vogesella sp. LIG4]SCK10417.1 UPF0716 protein FxsA [Vogesella sp. LIG4]
MRGFLILLLLYPFLEMYSLFWLADHIGGGWTLVWLLVSFVLGSMLMRGSKLGALLTIAGTLRQGNVNLFTLLWPLRIMIAGLLLAIPGLISDVFALLLLLPWPGPKLTELNMGDNFRQPPQNPPSGEADIIEGEYERVDPRTPSDRHLH